MRWRAHVTSIALVCLAGGALAYAYFDRNSVTVDEAKKRESNVFVAWRKEDLTRITLETGGKKLVVERVKDDAGDAEWWMRSPFDEKADAEACDRLASTLEFATVVRKVDPGVETPGLEMPRLTGGVDMGAVSHRFSLGADAAMPAGAAYLRVEGIPHGTVVVSQDLVAALLQSFDSYRSRRIVPYVSVELARLEVKRPDATLALARKDDVSFLLQPSGIRASREKLDDVWGALGEMRAEGFLTDDAVSGLVQRPQATVTLIPSAKDRTPGILVVGAPCPGKPVDVAVLRQTPTRLAVCAPKGILTGLGTTEADLEDRHLFAAHDDEVASLRIESLGQGPSLEIARKEGGWKELAPASRDLDGDENDAARALVADMIHAEGSAPEKNDDPFEARTKVTIRRAEGDVAEVVEVGAPDASGDVVVRRMDDHARLRVGAAVARRLAPRVVALRGKDVWSPPIERSAVTAIETRCEGIAPVSPVAQRVVREGDSWKVQVPAGFAPDNASILDLIDAVARVRADSWIADADDGHLGFAAPCSIALTLRADGGTRVARIEVGGDGEGGEYTRTSDSPAVFVAPRGLRDRASSWLVDLHGLTLPKIDAVVLERGDKKLTFSADAGAAPAAGVFDAAAVLRADSVVHLGPAAAGEGLAKPSLVVTLRSGATSKRVTFGADVEDAGTRSLYARVAGTDATFAVDRERLRAFLDPF
jgi:hypothetical protein